MNEREVIIKERIWNSFSRQGFLRLIDAKLETAECGHVETSCRRRSDLTQQQGFLHGGVLTSLADITCGYAALSVMPPDQEVLTVEFKINFLRPVSAEKIIAAADVIKPGRKLVITECRVYDSSDETRLNVLAEMLATMIPVPMTGQNGGFA